MRRALLLAIGVALAAAAPAGASPAAHVWVTTPDGARRWATGARVAFHPGGSDALTITVDPSRRYQTMDGFGASITDSSATLLCRLDRPPATPRCATCSARRQPALVPAPADGRLGLRRRATHYTYDDVPAGQTDYGSSTSRSTHDRKRRSCRCCARRSRSTRRLKVIADAVEPAGVDEDQRVADRRPADRRAADLRRRTRATSSSSCRRTSAAGVPVYALTVQNEPQNRNPSGYPGMDMPVAQQAKLIEALGPALRGRRPATRRSSATTTTGPSTQTTRLDAARRGPGDRVPHDLLTAAPARWIDGTAYPLLRRRPEPPDRAAPRVPGQGHLVHRVLGLARPDRPAGAGLLATPSSGTRATWSSASPATGARPSSTGTSRSTRSGGPHNGGCDTCTGVVTVGPDGTVTRNAEYYTLGHLARFVQPGAVRIASTSFGTTGWNGQIMDAAFRNPRRLDGARRAQRERRPAHASPSPQGDQSFDYTLPGGALATFTWPASRALDDGRTLLAAAAAATPARPPRPSTTTPRRAGRPGAAQAPGQSLQVDLGARAATCAASCSTPAPTPATSRAATPCSPAPTGRTGASAPRRRRRAADHDRHPGDRRALRAGRPDRDRAAVVVGRRLAGLPLRGGSS